MSRWRKIILFILWNLQILIFGSGETFARNDVFVENYIGFTKGRVCWRIDEKELDNFKSISCHYPYSSDLLYTSNNNIFEWSVFQKSADLQLKKNECVRQKINAIVNDDKLLEKWTAYLKNSWLGMKKAQLMLEKCESINYNTNERLGARINPNFTPRSDIDPKWLELCSDREHLDLLSASQALFVASMPIISDPAFFDIMEGERNALINKKTGKALSRDDIRDFNLQDHDTDMNKKSKEILMKKIKKKFRELSYERQTVSNDLLSNRDKKTKAYDMDTGTKDFLFEDNTVYETLSELKMLGNAEPSSEGSKIPMGVKCLLNRYQSDDNAEFAEFIALSFVSYVGLFKIFNISKLAKWEVLKKGRFMSTLVGGEVQAIKNIATVCSSDSYQKTKLNDRTTKQNPDFDTKPLKEELGFEFHDLEIPRNKMPACEGLEKNVVANDFKRSGCLINALKEHLLVF